MQTAVPSRQARRVQKKKGMGFEAEPGTALLRSEERSSAPALPADPQMLSAGHAQPYRGMLELSGRRARCSGALRAVVNGPAVRVPGGGHFAAQGSGPNASGASGFRCSQGITSKERIPTRPEGPSLAEELVARIWDDGEPARHPESQKALQPIGRHERIRTADLYRVKVAL